LCRICQSIRRFSDAPKLGRIVLRVFRQEPDFSISTYAKGLAYRNPEDLERIAEGLRRAGLPD